MATGFLVENAPRSRGQWVSQRDGDRLEAKAEGHQERARSAPTDRVARESKGVHFESKETTRKANSKVSAHFVNIHY